MVSNPPPGFFSFDFYDMMKAKNKIKFRADRDGKQVPNISDRTATTIPETPNRNSIIDIHKDKPAARLPVATQHIMNDCGYSDYDDFMNSIGGPGSIPQTGFIDEPKGNCSTDFYYNLDKVDTSKTPGPLKGIQLNDLLFEEIIQALFYDFDVVLRLYLD